MTPREAQNIVKKIKRSKFKCILPEEALVALKTIYESKKIREFLSESNNIENVWDEESLRDALKAWKYLNKCKTFTIDNILKAHGIMSRRATHIQNDQKGKFRKVAIWIGEREGKPWYALPVLMTQWVEKASTSKTIEEFWQDHISFEHIHPFVDFNGRMGRLIFLWQCIKNNVPIKVIYEKDKWEYYQMF